MLGLGFIGLGILFLALAWLLLVEYRKAFFADPASIMSFEVLALILRQGGPGYLAALALIVGAFFLSAGLVLVTGMTLAMIATLLGPLWEALRGCAVTPVVAHQAQGQAAQGRELSTLAPAGCGRSACPVR
jgi:hypothetical protein